ncbi:hypothetical protein LVY75_35095 (plasmid) [Sinorhizobium sp. B11]
MLANIMQRSSCWRLLVRALGLALLGLGILILVEPSIGALLFAAPMAGIADPLFLRALAARDLATGSWLLASPSISMPAATVSLFAIALIPFADLLLVLSECGWTLALVPHAASLFAVMMLALWGRHLA